MTKMILDHDWPSGPRNWEINSRCLKIQTLVLWPCDISIGRCTLQWSGFHHWSPLMGQLLPRHAVWPPGQKGQHSPLWFAVFFRSPLGRWVATLVANFRPWAMTHGRVRSLGFTAAWATYMATRAWRDRCPTIPSAHPVSQNPDAALALRHAHGAHRQWGMR